jgi:hypothetical protein
MRLMRWLSIRTMSYSIDICNRGLAEQLLEVSQLIRPGYRS